MARSPSEIRTRALNTPQAMSEVETVAEHDYILGAGESEQARLLAQSEIYRSEAEGLLDRVGIGAGDRALDVGCGPLGVLDSLSARVGPTGDVVGLDNEPRMIALAQQTIAKRRLANVRLVHVDASATGLAADSFDLAHERLLLINVPAPHHVVAETVRVVRPGGSVALQDVDWIAWTCEPPHRAWDALRDAIASARSATGLDPYIGRRLPALLRDAGLINVGIDVHAHVWRPGDLYHTLLLRFVAMHRQRILDGGFRTANQIDRLTHELEEHLARPDTFVIFSPLFQAWARKPL